MGLIISDQEEVRKQRGNKPAGSLAKRKFKQPEMEMTLFEVVGTIIFRFVVGFFVGLLLDITLVMFIGAENLDASWMQIMKYILFGTGIVSILFYGLVLDIMEKLFQFWHLMAEADYWWWRSRR